MRAKIDGKLEEVKKNLRTLEQHLDNHQVNSKGNKEEDITLLPLEILIRKLQDGSLSCVDVLRAYQAKVL